MIPRPITLRPTFTKTRRHAAEPDPITGDFYGRCGDYWYVHRAGVVERWPVLDWEELR